MHNQQLRITMTKSITKKMTGAELLAYISNPQFNACVFEEHIKVLDVHTLSSIIDKKNMTLLSESVKTFNAKAVEILLKYNADPTIRIPMPHSHQEWTAIYWAMNPAKEDATLSRVNQLKIVDLILNKASYDTVAVSTNPPLKSVSSTSTIVQLLLHGFSCAGVTNPKLEPALLTISQKLLKADQCLEIEYLHPKTIQKLEARGIKFNEVQTRAIEALKNGIAPAKIADQYTKCTLDALNSIAQELLDPKKPEAIRTFLEMSLDPQTQEYLISQNVNFAELRGAAIYGVLHNGLDPINKELGIFTQNARDVVEKVQTKLEADKSLLLTSNLHLNAFECMEEDATAAIKSAAIEKLKNGQNPSISNANSALTDHAHELIDAIAKEIKEDVSQWLAIKSLHPETQSQINASLKQLGSSIEMIEQEIQGEFKKGDDLGLTTSYASIISDFTPNTIASIRCLVEALQKNTTLICYIKLNQNIEELLNIVHNGIMTKICTKAINTLIAQEDRNALQYTDTLLNILIKNPQKILLLNDENINKIERDLGRTKFETLRTAATDAVKHGAHLNTDSTPTIFATSIFQGIFKTIKDNSTEVIPNPGIEVLLVFSKDSPNTTEIIRKYHADNLLKEAALQEVTHSNVASSEPATSWWQQLPQLPAIWPFGASTTSPIKEAQGDQTATLPDAELGGKNAAAADADANLEV